MEKKERKYVINKCFYKKSQKIYKMIYILNIYIYIYNYNNNYNNNNNNMIIIKVGLIGD